MAFDKQREHERQVKHEMESCIHFRGIQHDECAAGVHIRKLVGGPDVGWARRLPCMLMDADKCEVTCDARKLPTQEEAEATVAESERTIQKTVGALHACHEDAKAKGLKVGNGGRSSMACPVECGGTLHYTVAGINGHIHARCTTADCVSWME